MAHSPEQTTPYTSLRLWLMLGGWAAVVAALFAAAVLAQSEIVMRYLWVQDRWLLLAMVCVWLATLAAASQSWLRPWRKPAAVALVPWAPWALAGLLVALCWAGHYALLAGHSLSRDEQMVDFDAAIYATGHLSLPVPPEWRADMGALNSLFLLPVARPVAWVSAYLPGNAMAHALLGALTAPLAVGISVLALWGVARRLFPGDGGAPDSGASGVAVTLMVLSGQFFFAGMTNFAMPLHLACNLVWLWLFLRDERRADLAALALGFVATGLHQPLFHPMFVAPWLALLLWERRWGRLALFVGAYGAIGLFWLYWPHITLGLVMGPGSSIADAGTDYLSRLIDTLAQNKQNGPLMAANLLRMAVWTHPALWVLAALGLGACAYDRRAVALLGGIVLVLVVMTAILPYQGHGFGYRYLHGLLGNAALLGAYGWVRLGAWRARLRGAFVVASLGSMIVLMPMQGWFAHRLYAGFAEASAKIDASGADYVLIGIMDAPLALDLVTNRPDLANRPIRLSENDIDDVDRLAARICAKHATMALPRRILYIPIARALDMMPGYVAERKFAERASVFRDAGCKIKELR